MKELFLTPARGTTASVSQFTENTLVTAKKVTSEHHVLGVGFDPWSNRCGPLQHRRSCIVGKLDRIRSPLVRRSCSIQAGQWSIRPHSMILYCFPVRTVAMARLGFLGFEFRLRALSPSIRRVAPQPDRHPIRHIKRRLVNSRAWVMWASQSTTVNPLCCGAPHFAAPTASSQPQIAQ
jgi:hypothetical protein